MERMEEQRRKRSIERERKYVCVTLRGCREGEKEDVDEDVDE